jgi:hypothetical protein
VTCHRALTGQSKNGEGSKHQAPIPHPPPLREEEKEEGEEAEVEEEEEAEEEEGAEEDEGGGVYVSRQRDDETDIVSLAWKLTLCATPTDTVGDVYGPTHISWNQTGEKRAFTANEDKFGMKVRWLRWLVNVLHYGGPERCRLAVWVKHTSAEHRAFGCSM